MNINLVGNLSHKFVKRDYEILQRNFNVNMIEPPSTRDGWIKYPRKIKSFIRKSDLSLGWFAGWHTLPMVYYSRKNKKKSVVIVGGYDAANIPEIDYGAFSNLKERIPAKYVLKNSDLLLAVSKFTMNEVLEKIKVKEIKVIHNGVNIKTFTPKDKKEDIVITVGAVNQNNLKRKGLETFVKTANLIPEVKFVVVGKIMDNAGEYLRSIASSNIDFTGFVSDSELLSWYQKSKVVCQLSYYEAFGLSPAEGMACGCIPVVTKDRAGISEFVGKTGYYVPFGDICATADAIKSALKCSKNKGIEARKRIEDLFSIDRREMELTKILRKMMAKNELFTN